MKNGITEIVFILDKSGSMAGFEGDTVGGFNSVIERHREGEGRAYVSTVLFSNDSRVVHDREDITGIRPMERRDFCVGGCTALYDAIGGAIHHIGNVHKYARAEDVPDKTLFFIMTDGMENASRIYDQRTVRAQIERQREKYGWEFIFMAANIDAEEGAESLGIGRDRAIKFEQTDEGFDDCFYCAAEIFEAVRGGASLDGEDIKAKRRKRK